MTRERGRHVLFVVLFVLVWAAIDAFAVRALIDAFPAVTVLGVYVGLGAAGLLVLGMAIGAYAVAWLTAERSIEEQVLDE